tara:strand:- start:340 stop:576 length:237 start_codon:yes stop_codon:yes gene_type:complete
MAKFLSSNISTFLVNLFFLIFLLLGIQNSYERNKIKFLNYESAAMPISFILGTSFISGSILGNFIFSLLLVDNKNSKS